MPPAAAIDRARVFCRTVDSGLGNRSMGHSVVGVYTYQSIAASVVL